jgi:hypothetical protein
MSTPGFLQSSKKGRKVNQQQRGKRQSHSRAAQVAGTSCGRIGQYGEAKILSLGHPTDTSGMPKVSTKEFSIVSNRYFTNWGPHTQRQICGQKMASGNLDM